MVSRRRNVELLQEWESRPTAPVYSIAKREVIAVEHPMIIRNLDNALKTFGTNRPFRRILDSDDPDECLPLYLRPNDPTCVPILSHNGATNNVLLKVTVPKRTERKRKRGSEDPYNDCNVSAPLSEDQSTPDPTQHIRSQSRMDAPFAFMRSLKDTAGKYTIEAVAHVNQTHRFRGLSDFHQSTSHGTFMPKLKETMLTGDVTKMRDFTLDRRVGYQLNEEILPPPLFTGHSLPFNWAWQQNPNIFTEIDRNTGEKILVNHSKPADVQAKYLSHDAKLLPSGPPSEIPNDPAVRALVKSLQDAFEERPIWTRRGLTNRMGSEPFFYMLRFGLQYVGYQFKGGPFRDAIIKYGIDPRSDKKYRKYQTLFFKLFEDEERLPGMPWQDLRIGNVPKNLKPETKTNLFDGKTLTLDGRIWQLCDISDPLLARLIENSPYRATFDTVADGWFPNGAYAKIRTIMRVKLIAIRTSKEVADEDFKAALEVPDTIPGEKRGRNIRVPVPDLRLTEEEVETLLKKGKSNALGPNGLRKRIRKRHQKRARQNMIRLGEKEPNQRRGRPRVEMLPSEIWGEDKGKTGTETERQQPGKANYSISKSEDRVSVVCNRGGRRQPNASRATDENGQEDEGQEGESDDDEVDDSDGSDDVEDDSGALDGEEEEDEADSDVTDDVDYQVLYGPNSRLASAA